VASSEALRVAFRIRGHWNRGIHEVMAQGVARAITARTTGEPLHRLPQPLRAVFAEHAPFVLRSLRWLGVRKAELDDTFKQIFSIAYQEPRDHAQTGQVRAWLYSICRRVTGSPRYDRQRHDTPQELFGEDAAATVSLERLGHRAAATLGRRLLSQLPAPQREVFVLYEVENLPLALVAQATGCSLRRVRLLLSAAREQVLAEVERMAAECEHD
jgi:RNA polymerase sigma-70 factor, ECF subfamily